MTFPDSSRYRVQLFEHLRANDFPIFRVQSRRGELLPDRFSRDLFVAPLIRRRRWRAAIAAPRRKRGVLSCASRRKPAREGLEPISTVRSQLRGRVTHTYVHRWHVLDSRSMCIPPPRSAREFRPQLHFARPRKRTAALAELLLLPAFRSCARPFVLRCRIYGRGASDAR